ncbi:MAG: ATP-binding protein [Pseudomonadota bacterium]
MLILPDATPEPPRVHHAHHVRFYAEDAALIDEVADFLDAALRAGDAAVVIATEEHRAQLQRRLAGIGPRQGMPAWYSGTLRMLDARQTLDCMLVDGELDAQRFTEVVGGAIAEASSNGTREVRAFGEMVALLYAQGRHEQALQLEALWNGLAQLQAFTLLCAYPMDLFAGDEHASTFRSICCAHHDVGPVHLGSQGEGALALASAQQRVASLEAEVARRRQAERTLKQREKELLDFLENAAEGLHRVGPDGTLLWANKAELELLGRCADEYIGHHVAEFHDDPTVIAGILQRLQRGETVVDEPAVLRHKDGSLRHVLITTNACFEDGQLRYTRCFTRDVTERVQAQAERERLLQELETALRAKDEFLAMLGHELRNPLSPIVTALHLMKMRGDSRTAREQAIIERQLDHLTRLVDDLLDVSRITRGKVELRKERIELAEVLMKAVEMASPLLEQRDHRLQIDVPPEGLACDADPVRLAQVVANLLTNAARYTPAGGLVELHAWREQDEVVVRVRDNGIGISADMLPRLFDLFFQGGRSLERREGGLGLGLALVKTLVGLHGGSVVASSAGPDQGSEFTVRLPAPPGRVHARPAQAVGQRVRHPRSRGLRVLIVDDNADAAQTLGRHLAQAGHEVKVLHDPAQALQQAAGFQPDAALLAIGLPVMDGYELALQLRQRLAAAPCRLIALAGYGQGADPARCRQAGFDQHLLKPVDPGGLLQLLQP